MFQPETGGDSSGIRSRDKGGTTEAAGEETKAPEAGEEVTDLKGKMMGVVTPAADHGFTAESIQHCGGGSKDACRKIWIWYKFMTAAESGEQSNAVETILGMNPDVMVLWPVTGDELEAPHSRFRTQAFR